MRAVVSSFQFLPVQTFEYDTAGRLLTVGDERPHSQFSAQRYSYDEQGRVILYQESCYGPADDCNATYELLYRDDGTLERMEYSHSDPERSETTVYDEAGNILERQRANLLWTYEYRSDGQLDFITQLDKVRQQSFVSQQSSYGPEGLLREADYFDSQDIVSAVESYTYDGGRLVSRSRVEDYSVDHVHFDALERPAFSILWSDANTGEAYRGYLDDVIVFEVFEGSAEAYVVKRFANIEPPHTLFPVYPYEFSADVAPDFVIEIDDKVYAKRYSFDAGDRVERIEFDYFAPERPLVINVLRCDGVILETVRYPTSDDDDAIVYYYGCDDFVLPSHRD